MYAVRRFAVRHARFFESFYNGFERFIVALDPLCAASDISAWSAPSRLSRR
jgi:hypothetical protein